METFPYVLDDVRSMMSITVQFTSSVKCLLSCGSSVAVGCEDGTVALLSHLSDITSLGKHTEAVQCLAAHRDVLLSADSKGTIMCWSVSERKELCKLLLGSQWTRALAFSKDGKIAYAAGEEKLVRVWRTSTWTELESMRGHEGAVSCLVGSPDGKYLASGSHDRSVKVWENCREKATLRGHVQDVTCLAVTANSHWLLSGSQDSTIIIWDLTDFTQHRSFDTHKAAICCLTVTPDSKSLISASADHSLKLFDLAGMREVATLLGHQKEINAVLVTPDSKTVVSVSKDCTVKLWSLLDHQEVTTFKGHQDCVYAVAISGDGSHLATGSKDCTIRLWSFDDLKEVSTLGIHSACVTCLALSPDGASLVSGSADSTLQVYSLSTASLSASLLSHKNCVTALTITADSKLAISGSDDTSVKLWDLSSLTELYSFEGHTKGINCVLATSDCLRGVSGSSDKKVKVWDLQRKREIATLNKHSGAVLCLALSIDERQLLTGSFDTTIKVWSMTDFSLIGSLLSHTSEICEIIPVTDSLTVLSRGKDAEIKVWNLTDLSEIVMLMSEEVVSCMVVSPNYCYFVSAVQETLSVWTSNSNTPIAWLHGHCDEIVCVKITPDSQFIVSGGKDAFLVVWSYRDMQEIARYCGHTAPIRVLCISSDGRFVVSGSDDNTVQYYDLTCQVAVLRDTMEEPLSATLAEPGKNSFFASSVERMKDGEVVHASTAARVVLPYYFNALHVCAYFNHADALCAYLSAAVPIVRGAFGTHLTVALRRNTLKCVDVTLCHLASLCDDKQRWIAVQAITDDLPGVIRTSSPKLVAFLLRMFSKTFQPRLSNFIVPSCELPILKMNENWFVNMNDFEDTQSELQQEAVEFLTSDMRWNFEIGSRKSLELLSALETCDDRKVLTTPLILTILNWKWDRLMPMTLILTCLYSILLVSMVCHIFHYGPSTSITYLFFGLNVFFFLYEGMQSMVNGSDYWKDPWNYLDWVRSSVCMLWVLYLEGYLYVELLAVCMCFLRGFTYFRTFKMTRMFVRMTLEVVKEMYSFLILFAYTTIAFGMMYAVLVPEQAQNAFGAWMTAYELLMGTYSTVGFEGLQWMCFTSASLVNVIIMLNLLISILGDAFEHAQANAKENDTLEQLLIIIEYESMLFWRRNINSSSVLILCCSTEGQAADVEWQGKVNSAAKAVAVELKRVERRFGEDLALRDEKMRAVEKLVKEIERKVTVAEEEMRETGRTLAQTGRLEGEETVGKRFTALETKVANIGTKMDLMAALLAKYSIGKRK